MLRVSSWGRSHEPEPRGTGTGSRYNRAGGLEGGMLREIPTLGANPVPAVEVCEEGERAAPSPPRWKIRERGLHGAEGCDRGRPCGT